MASNRGSRVSASYLQEGSPAQLCATHGSSLLIMGEREMAFLVAVNKHLLLDDRRRFEEKLENHMRGILCTQGMWLKDGGKRMPRDAGYRAIG